MGNCFFAFKCEKTLFVYSFCCVLSESLESDLDSFSLCLHVFSSGHFKILEIDIILNFSIDIPNIFFTTGVLDPGGGE